MYVSVSHKGASTIFNKILYFQAFESNFELDMCLWNTDAPGGNKVQIWQNLSVPNFDPAQPPGACDVSEVWETLGWTYSPSLVTVWPPKL